MQKEKQRLGVIVGRFQTPALHAGHHLIVQHVLRRHEQVLVLLGTRRAQPVLENALDYQTRKLMFEEMYPWIDVQAVEDVGNDIVWSENLDAQIKERYPEYEVILYGSRDSFSKGYHGIHQVEDVPVHESRISATHIRSQVVQTPINSKEFRAGVLYATGNRYPTMYQTVDLAIFNKRDKKILLGQKARDEGKWRFIGGFTDTQDTSLEESVLREACEEVGSIKLERPQYIGSKKVADWRYLNTQDGIMTTLFISEYIEGDPVAQDDLDAVRWFLLSEIESVIIKEHIPLVKMLKRYLQ